MDDINKKLNTLLSDPDSMARIMQQAQQLSGGSGGQQTAAPSPPPPAAPPAVPNIDPQLIARFLPLIQEFSRDNSQTTQLLYALRPFLKDGKQEKVERAAKLARLICIGKRFLTEGGGPLV